MIYGRVCAVSVPTDTSPPQQHYKRVENSGYLEGGEMLPAYRMFFIFIIYRMFGALLGVGVVFCSLFAIFSLRLQATCASSGALPQLLGRQ